MKNELTVLNKGFGTQPFVQLTLNHSASEMLKHSNTRRRSTREIIKDVFIPSYSTISVNRLGGYRKLKLEQSKMNRLGYIIHPLSTFRQYWDLLIMCSMIVNMFLLPLEMAFLKSSNTFTILNSILDGLCFVDIFLNFRTAYSVGSQNCHFELDQRKIVFHYLKTWFVLDLLGSFPFHLITSAISQDNVNSDLGMTSTSRVFKLLKIARLLNLLKILRCSRIVRGISRFEKIYNTTAIFMRYTKLLSVMVLVAHWNGCLHFFVPMLQDFPDGCWVKLSGLENEHWTTQYVWALFKALSHMLCIGYGRSIPILLSEAILTIFTMITGATFYALFVAHSMVFVLQQDISKGYYTAKMKEIDDYMMSCRLPEVTKTRVHCYFEQKYNQGRFFNESTVLSVISPLLRQEILKHLFQELTANVSILKRNSRELQSEILNKLTYEVYLAGDHIVKENTLCDEMFFITNGNAVMSVGNEIFKYVGKDSHFGEINALARIRSLCTVKALTTCHTYALSRKDLEILIEDHPSIQAKFEHEALTHLILICAKCSSIKAEEDKMNSVYIITVKLARQALVAILNKQTQQSDKTIHIEDLLAGKTCDDKTLHIDDLLSAVVLAHNKRHDNCDIYQNFKNKNR